MNMMCFFGVLAAVALHTHASVHTARCYCQKVCKYMALVKFKVFTFLGQINIPKALSNVYSRAVL